jgi:putative DNA primase/helicase
VVVNEAPRGGRLTVETAKNIVSEDEIAGERKHRDPKSFAPSHKIVWALNDLPEIPSDPAVFRRLRLIPFDFQPSVPDEHLAATLEAELPGILAWAARGCQEWLGGGLRCPAKVMARVKALEEEADAVGEWMRECCELGPSFSAPRAALHEHFFDWAGRSGKPGLSARLFFADLEKKGLTQRVLGTEARRVRSFLGIRVRSDPDSPFGGIGSGAGPGSTPKTGGGIDLSDLDEILKLN